MIKKIYGLTEDGKQVELDFRQFVMVTENNSNLIIDATNLNHPDKPDLFLHVNSAPNEQRYFNVLPGAVNSVFIKAICRDAD